MITETIGFLNSKLMNFEAVMKIKNVFSERGTSSKFSIFRAVFTVTTLTTSLMGSSSSALRSFSLL